MFSASSARRTSSRVAPKSSGSIVRQVSQRVWRQLCPRTAHAGWLPSIDNENQAPQAAQYLLTFVFCIYIRFDGIRLRGKGATRRRPTKSSKDVIYGGSILECLLVAGLVEQVPEFNKLQPELIENGGGCGKIVLALSERYP